MPAVESWRKDLERVAGAEAAECPWLAFCDPLVAKVLELVAACGGAQGFTPALLLPMDPPHAVWQGVLLYVQTRNRVVSHDDGQRAKQREAEMKRKSRVR